MTITGDITCGHQEADALVRELLTRIGEKWTVLVIGQLESGAQRFTALMELTPGISHRMLTRTLRASQMDGLISRTAYAESPPRVEYALTPLGRTLIAPLDALYRWGLEHHEEVMRNRSGMPEASSRP